MTDDLVEHVGFGIGGVEMGRVDVARHDREEVDIFLRQRPDRFGLIADTDLVEGSVLDHRGARRGHDRHQALSSMLVYVIARRFAEHRIARRSHCRRRDFSLGVQRL